ncbi:glycosyltransferase family 4 protein [Litoribacter alkaliphilus]|uniref:Glycosyltransferase family 4 protein n=1 Tax=Litoribacter ruber TaxID=702568 RepID=A0AAP2CHP6_9BACT|nr:glycosyltransferase family 1 protein [Litoribacter alkaliphilus]MBS9523451.1 glycosyltransferase family 4 protein [Litoribacter alkaliphilus]
MKKRVYVDLFYLNTALTGIKTYMLEFVEAVNEHSQDDLEYIFSHDPEKQATQTFFRGDVPYWRKLLYHIYYFYYKQLVLPLRLKFHKADHLICFDFVAPALNSKPNIVVVHDAFFWQMPQNYNAHWRKYFLKAIYWGLKENTTVVTTSRYAKASIEQATPIKHPIEVIYQCPRLLPDQADDRILEELELWAQGYFLHIGSFDKRKDLTVLIKAFAKFDQKYPGEKKLVLVGERGLSVALDDYPAVVGAIREYRLEEKVVLPGFLPDKKVKSLYRNAFAYIFPSSNEGFGIPVIEAMHNQIPVLISDQAALAEVAGGAALVSPIGDVDNFAKQMEKLHLEPQLRENLIQKGLIRTKVFSRQNFYESFHQLISNG